MTYYQARDPDSYQTIFYKQIGLKKVPTSGLENRWEEKNVGYICTCGRMDSIQFGIGEYTVPNDFLVEFQYDTEYLHAGIIYEGVTYSLVENRMEAAAKPSAFLAVEKVSGGINCWKRGQHFKGVELSVEMSYLKRELLPFLGLAPGALDFLEKNVRYCALPAELLDILLGIQKLLQERAMTEALLRANAAAFAAQLARPDSRALFSGDGADADAMGQVRVGNRRIHMNREDFQKILRAHDLLRDHADSFVTIYALSQRLGIGEQKLKAGFLHVYQQTIWDYANQVRMTRAAGLLKDTKKSVDEISRLTGYQSQAAFRAMFKKWSGTTPGKFRSVLSGSGRDQAPAL